MARTRARSAFRGLSNPRRCRFFVKNSETEISRCRAPISTAVTPEVDFSVSGDFLDDATGSGTVDSDRNVGAEDSARGDDVLVAIQPLKQ